MRRNFQKRISVQRMQKFQHDVQVTVYYRPQRSWGKVIFLHVSVILFTGWGDLPHCMLEYTPPDQRQTPPRGRHTPRTRHPPGADTPPGVDPPEQTPLPAQCMLGDTANKQVVRILLECNLVICLLSFRCLVMETNVHLVSLNAITLCIYLLYSL